ncbi:relaxase/mobilization nuclease domain-containing protein [Erwinia persicina]|uniref:Relaxase/mobilization nuclease domain-containing protein n=1 Tax=Erwinia persicina TaxID=55211 RepID=A0ABR8ZXI4_9GAMM|nr:relaxase/mobilization nuclease domain-containing protein [Erwinia persicina]MBD8108303.1 relaxase/mobilization nuclease domain-containing protein [Erwinia persicina]MBD8211290.1 relaxase/mobilization nuclease domain-containing protein [Erwinia persicina]
MKGMDRIKRGKNFRGVISYALSPANHHKVDPMVIGGNLVGSTVDELATEFTATQKLREYIEKPVWHNSLRLPKGDSLANEQWRLIADDYMKRMGFSDTHLRCYVLHDDEAGQHIHIIASRINILANGQLYLGRNENLISTRIIQDLEQDHKLTRTKGPSPQKASQKQRKLNRNEKMMQDRTKEKAPKIAIQEAIDAILTFFDTITIEDFVGELRKQNITANANIASTGKMSGFSFEYHGIAFKASQLGKAYSWSNMSKRIIVAQPKEAITPVFTPVNVNFPILTDVHSTATLIPLTVSSSEHSRYRWLQWIPYLEELVASLKAIGLTILKPVKKTVLIKKIMDKNPKPVQFSKVGSQDLVRKSPFNPV